MPRLYLASPKYPITLSGTFGGNLIAVLTVSKDKPPFNTLAEMASQSDYTFGTLGNSMWTTLFEVRLTLGCFN